jgi:methylglutaconyl-CoA hydratase
MEKFTTIQVKLKGTIARIYLNRPNVRNAFNNQMIEELNEAFNLVEQQYQHRALIIRGNGPVFSAGADLNWMKSSVDNTYEQNIEETKQLQDLFENLYNLPVPTISLVHGACIGGANGLAAASDIVLAEQNTQFRFSEVRIGLVPATIAPFILRRTGQYAAKYYMLTGKIFRSDEALRIGMADAAGSMESLDTELDIILKELHQNSPQAMRNTKKLINEITRSSDDDQIRAKTIGAIARARTSKEGQEGMRAFLEKRKPWWLQDEYSDTGESS